MPSAHEHIVSANYNSLRQDRDRWAQVAADQLAYIRQLEQQVLALQEQLQTFNHAEENTATLPPENDYQALIQWLSAEKILGNDYYADAGFNRSKMCRELRKILGWEPDQNSLRKAQNK